jgi:hypothetical protein
MSAIDDTRRKARDRAWAYRNRNSALGLPTTRDVDAALVEAVRATFAKRGFTEASQIEPGTFEHEIVARTMRGLADARISVRDSREARDRVQRRLGFLVKHGSSASD